MSSSPIETVTAFLSEWGKGIPQLRRSMHDYLALDAVYENIGLSRTVGPAEAELAFMSFEPMKTSTGIRVEILAMAADHETVLQERVDYVLGAAGEVTMTVRAMGSFEVREGKITAWRDYFDTFPFNG